MSNTIHNRFVVQTFAGIPTSDGAGVKLERVIGQPGLPDLDPFLLFDAFGSDDPGRLYRGLSRSPASRLRNSDLYAGRAHAPSRQPRQRRPADSGLGAMDDGGQWPFAFRNALSRKKAAWPAFSFG